MAGAEAAGLPTLMDEPGARRVGEIGADDAEGFAGDETGFAQEQGALGGAKIRGQAGGRDFGAPKNLVGHPIADAGKAALHEEDGFDGGAAVTIEKPIEERAAEGAVADLREIGRPPLRVLFAMMKADAAEEARIAEDEGAFRLPEDEVVVFADSEIRRLDPHGAAHAEVKAEPVLAGEFEEHLFPARDGTEELRAGETKLECAHVAAAEDAFPRVELDCGDTGAEAGIPLAAVVFDFGELRHGAN